MDKIRTISVVGLGKLGLPLSNVMAEKYEVIRIEKRGFKPKTNIVWTTSYDELGDITFIIVPTPSLPNGKFSSRYVEEVLERIRQKQRVVIVSTLYPGETERLQKLYPYLTIYYNPTFVALGQVYNDLICPNFILIGASKGTGVLKGIWNSVCHLKPKFAVLSPLEAEITKLALNCYVTNKITFANQIGNLCYKLGVSGEKVCEAIGTDKRIGNYYFKPGLGYGGPCFPRDNIALSAYLEDNKLNPALFRTVNKLNEWQIDEIVNRMIVERIKKGKPVSMGFEGLSYKRGTDNSEYSQLKEIYQRLKAMGYKVKVGKGEVNINWEGITNESNL